MWALLVKIWVLGTGLLGSMTRATTETRSDFTAVTNVLQAELTRQGNIIATEVDRRERQQKRLDEVYAMFESQRDENAQLRKQLADEVARNDRLQAKFDEMQGLVEQLREENTQLRQRRVEDEATICKLTDRVAFLEAREKEAARKSQNGGGI